MPTPYLADEIAKADKVTGSIDLAKRVDGPKFTPRVSIVRSTYTMLGTEVAGEKVELCRLNQGACVMSHLSELTSDGIATTCTLDVGDDDPTADQDRYCAAANIAANNARVLFSATGNPVAAVAPYVVAQDCWLIATFLTLTVPVAGKKLRVLTCYVGA